nr:branched-chain amino acid ABC transporter permease [uncultured Dysosmobacter sp.]
MNVLQEKKSKRGTVIVLLCTLALLALVILLENTMKPTHMLFTVLKKGAVYAVVASSMNLLNGFTGLFSLGQAGFMLLGAYTYAILTIPVAARESVYYIYQGSAINFSLPELFGGGPVGLVLGVLAALVLAGCVAAVVAWLIGLPVLRLKSDYLAIATLGFGEIVRAVFQWDKLGPVTNGANALKSYPTFSSFNIETAGGFQLRLSTFVPFLLGAVCIGVILLLINSTYGRAFKAVRDDEVAAEAMGINLSKHKRLAFCISSFFAGVGGGMFAMFANQAQAKTFTTAMTYEILLIVVIGGIGSISGSCLASFLYVAASEWWLRFLDTSVTFQSAADPKRIAFIVIYSVVVLGGGLLLILRERRGEKKRWKQITVAAVALALMGWLAKYLMSGSMTMPFLRNGFRMVAFSLIIMVIVLFFRQGLMGDKELPNLLRRSRRKTAKGGSANV